MEKETGQQNIINETEEKKPAENEGLTPEKIGHLLKVLGDDIINDMLESAGLSSEIEPEGEPGQTEAVPEEGVRRRHRPRHRFLFVIVFALIIMTLYAMNQIYMSARLNADDPIAYSTSNDDISCTQGVLKVNDVRVSVPSDGKEEYSISYSWAEEDLEYPSVPHAITAIYYDESGEEPAPLYSISLYRNDTITASSIPEGKNAGNWFDDWPIEADDIVRQELRKTDSVSGFYIYPERTPPDAEAASDYNNYSYYFAVEGNKCINIYVLEGEWLSTDAEKNKDDIMPEIMDDCIQKIKLANEEPDTEE